MIFKKTALFFVCALLAAHAGKCQEASGPQTENVARFTFLSPGMGYEQKIGKRSTLMGHAFIAAYASFNYSDAVGFESEFSLEPAYTLQWRHYYNLAKRQEAGKRIAKNSGNYVAPLFRSFFSKRPMKDEHFSEDGVRAVNTLGVVWGLQRNMERRFSLDFQAGLGYLFAPGTAMNSMGTTYRENVGKPTLLTGITLGIWLGKVAE